MLSEQYNVGELVISRTRVFAWETNYTFTYARAELIKVNELLITLPFSTFREDDIVEYFGGEYNDVAFFKKVSDDYICYMYMISSFDFYFAGIEERCNKNE